MNGLCHKTFAGSVFTSNEHVGIRWSRALDQLKYWLHGGRLRNQLRSGIDAKLFGRFQLTTSA